MEIVVRGKNRPVSKHLAAVSREKVARIARFTHDAGRVEVDFSVQQHRRDDESQLCEITVHLKKHFVKAHACAPEPEAALDLAVDKVGHQVARIKDKRVSRSHPRRGNGAVSGNWSENSRHVGGSLEGNARGNAIGISATPTASGGDHPRIVKTKRFGQAHVVRRGRAQMELLGRALPLREQ
jgi:ribosomal subunit interface protein